MTHVGSPVHVLLQKPAGVSANLTVWGCSLPAAQAQLALAGILPWYFPGSILATRHRPLSCYLVKLSVSALARQAEQSQRL